MDRVAILTGMRIALGADHAGWELKTTIRGWLEEHGHEVEDLGTDSGASVDYPDFARRVSRSVSGGTAERGVLVCGTGAGMAIAANRHPGVRAVNCIDPFTARMARSHNDANVLALGARVVGPGLALELLQTFLEEPFAGGRHARRVELIEQETG
ncbi:MAG TPA: ribose 5-phosphate isomerase B [Thermoanaerobaculia bacterium]|nr:ribose 5-phosphate isomerase B [Thermoanaerobaculia bacterium]